MGITIPGLSFPKIPAKPNPASVSAFEDFLYGQPLVAPIDIIGIGATNAFGTPPAVPLDPVHPGLIWADLSLGPLTLQWLPPNPLNYLTLQQFVGFDLEFVMQITATPAAATFSAGLTLSTATGAQNQDSVGIQCSLPGGVNANTPNGDWWLSTDNNHVSSTYSDSGVTFASLAGAYHKYRINWASLPVPTVRLFIDDSLKTSITTNLPSGTVMIPTFACGGSGSPAGIFHMLDYVKFSGTLAR